jgi:hypothetical protein
VVNQVHSHRELITDIIQESEFLSKYQRNKKFAVKVFSIEKGGLVAKPLYLTLVVGSEVPFFLTGNTPEFRPVTPYEGLSLAPSSKGSLWI